MIKHLLFEHDEISKKVLKGFLFVLSLLIQSQLYAQTVCHIVAQVTDAQSGKVISGALLVLDGRETGDNSHFTFCKAWLDEKPCGLSNSRIPLIFFLGRLYCTGIFTIDVCLRIFRG